MYPRDTLTYVASITGNSSLTVVATSTNTILGIRLQQSGTASETVVKCGTTTIAHNFGKDYPMAEMNYVCTNLPIIVSKTGNDTSFYIVSYVQRDRQITLDPQPYTSTINTMATSTQSALETFSNTYTYLGFILFGFIALAFVYSTLRKLF